MPRAEAKLLTSEDDKSRLVGVVVLDSFGGGWAFADRACSIRPGARGAAVGLASVIG